MAWETRQRGGRYYRRSFRINGRVRNEYLGTGPVAELAALADQERRDRQAAADRLTRAAEAEAEAIDREVATYCRAVDQLTAEILTAAGFHRPKRGAWRRKVGSKRELAVGTPPTKEEALAVIRRAEKGDPEAMAAVRKMADGPFTTLWDAYGNMPVNVTNLLVDVASGTNVLRAEGIRKKLAEVRDQAAGTNPSPLEELLAERVALCWLQCYYEDWRDVKILSEANAPLSVSLAQQKRAAVAQKRYLAAIKALAQVRRLELPATLQVNVGGQQVNLVSG